VSLPEEAGRSSSGRRLQEVNGLPDEYVWSAASAKVQHPSSSEFCKKFATQCAGFVLLNYEKTSGGCNLKKIILFVTILFCAAMINNVAAQNNASVSKLTVLKEDSGNLSEMILLPYSTFQDFGEANGLIVGEAVKFTSPKAGWKLSGIQVIGLTTYNNTTKDFAPNRNFLVEVRDKDLNLLYKFADMQNLYFASNHEGRFLSGSIMIPSIPVNGDFYVVFYDRGSMKIGMEKTNETSNSFFFIGNQMKPATFEMAGKTNETMKVNWLIRVAGA
jgi:hypothetical protein